jgi:hypothetical protein
MPEAIYIIQPYARRGERIAVLPPIRTPDEVYAKQRAKRLASVYGNCGAAVLAQKLDDDGKSLGRVGHSCALQDDARGAINGEAVICATL